MSTSIRSIALCSDILNKGKTLITKVKGGCLNGLYWDLILPFLSKAVLYLGGVFLRLEKQTCKQKTLL